ncbi:MAG: hypothetical protein Q4C75_02005 [Bergeyella zoohelcum]|nr:hypothetical protein [Bergeyella zoohelcum]
MKKTLVALAVGISSMAFAQENEGHKKKNDPIFEAMSVADKERFKKASSEEKIKMFREMQIQMMLKKLNLSAEKQTPVKVLLEDYFAERDAVFKQFKNKESDENLTNEEALKRIKTGFDTAQKLLDVRKIYTDKFLKELSPQQVIRLHKMEKEMMSHFKKHRDK